MNLMLGLYDDLPGRGLLGIDDLHYVHPAIEHAVTQTRLTA